MKTRRLTDKHDWTMGASRSDYLTKTQAVAQSVKTRLLSFKRDWFLDADSNIEWVGLLGMRNNQEPIRRAVESTILGTVGVLRIDNLDIKIKGRAAVIDIELTDIYGEKIQVTTNV